MNFKAEIKVYEDIDRLYELFYPEMEDERNKHDRSSFKMSKRKDHLLFVIEAKDAVALRATFNSLTKLLTVKEKIEKI